MKVVISYPPLESDKGAATLGQNRQFQWFSNPSYIYPMVPASAATLLAQRGYEVMWNDAIAEGWTYPQFLEFFERERPDVIALETKTPVVKQHWRIIDELKSIHPETQVVLMGDQVTALPEGSMRNCLVDFVITGGDYDFSLLSICEHLSKHGALEAGIWFREGEQIKNTGLFQLRHDLNSLPLIDRELTKWHLYGEHLFKKPCTYTMVGRDCWYHQCTFCSWPTLYPRFRVRSPESLLGEVGLILEKYPVKEIFDDTGTFPVGRWLEEFCRGMIERGYAEEVYFSCNMRVGALNFDEYALMRKAGFRVLKFGLESASQQTLDRLNKGTTVEQITESCKQAKKAGLEPHLTSMVGYPWETEEDACRTLDLARRLFHEGYADTIQATVVMPYPGSPLFAEAEANGWLKYDHDWEKYDMTRPVLISPIDDREIMELVNGLYGSFMSPRFIMRKLLSIRSWDDAKYLSNAGKVAVQHILDFKRGGQAIRSAESTQR